MIPKQHRGINRQGVHGGLHVHHPRPILRRAHNAVHLAVRPKPQRVTIARLHRHRHRGRAIARRERIEALPVKRERLRAVHMIGPTKRSPKRTARHGSQHRLRARAPNGIDDRIEVFRVAAMDRIQHRRFVPHHAIGKLDQPAPRRRGSFGGVVPGGAQKLTKPQRTQPQHQTGVPRLQRRHKLMIGHRTERTDYFVIAHVDHHRVGLQSRDVAGDGHDHRRVNRGHRGVDHLDLVVGIPVRKDHLKLAGQTKRGHRVAHRRRLAQHDHPQRVRRVFRAKRHRRTSLSRDKPQASDIGIVAPKGLAVARFGNRPTRLDTIATHPKHDLGGQQQQQGEQHGERHLGQPPSEPGPEHQRRPPDSCGFKLFAGFTLSRFMV